MGEKSIYGGITCGFFCISIITGAIVAPLLYFYISIGNKYSDDSCLKQVDTPDLSLWLRVYGWTLVGFAATFMAGLVLSGCCIWCFGVFGLCPFVTAIVAIVPILLFNAAWSIIGMIRLAQSTKCHEHAPELWCWAFAAVLISACATIGVGSSGDRINHGVIVVQRKTKGETENEIDL